MTYTILRYITPQNSWEDGTIICIITWEHNQPINSYCPNNHSVKTRTLPKERLFGEQLFVNDCLGSRVFPKVSQSAPSGSPELHSKALRYGPFVFKVVHNVAIVFFRDSELAVDQNLRPPLLQAFVAAGCVKPFVADFSPL